jgi:hypothetical protein
MRVDMVSVANPSASNFLAGSTYQTMYLNPIGNGAGTIALTNKANVASAATCATTCAMTVTGLGGNAYHYARITPEYRGSQRLVITGVNSDGSTAHFNGAQAVVDVTGKAQDTLRRVQARISLGRTYDPLDLPTSALSSSATICKTIDASTTAGSQTDLTNSCL